MADGGRTYLEGMEYTAHGGLLSEALGNGTVHSASYNTRLQATQIKLTQGTTVLQRYDYAYGEVDATTGAVDATKNTGQIARIEGYIGAAKQWQQRMSYDQLGRLTLASEHPGTSTTDLTYRADYGYDRYGNRSQESWQNQGIPYTEVRAIDISSGTNRYKSVTGVEYDASGQVRVDPKFRGREYQYEANGRQRRTARLDGTGVATALYDGAGQRVETTANGETRQVVYDAYGQMVAEYEGGVWARDYIYRGGQVVATVEAGATVRYVMSDLQGSARVTMDASGVILARHDYLPFGEEIQSGTGLRTTAQGYGAADERKQQYALLERDEETGQDHAWWRKYESTAGRWTTPDPYTGSQSIGDPQSFNRYSYVENDPVNFVDPSGLEETLTCYVDGIPVSCSFGLSLINSGAGYLNGPPGFYGGGSLLVTYAGNLSVDGLGLGFQQAFLTDPQERRSETRLNSEIRKAKNCVQGKLREHIGRENAIRDRIASQHPLLPNRSENRGIGYGALFSAGVGGVLGFLSPAPGGALAGAIQGGIYGGATGLAGTIVGHAHDRSEAAKPLLAQEFLRFRNEVQKDCYDKYGPPYNTSTWR